MTKKPDITQGKLKEFFLYDPNSGVFRRRAGDLPIVKNKPNAGGYCRIAVDGKMYYVHRLAWLYVYGEFPPYQLDHINLIKTDNRIENLRPATQQENSQNLLMPRSNTSGVCGVTWCRIKKKWHARIRVGNKRIQIGYYKNIDDAATAMAEAKAKYHTFNPITPTTKPN